MNNQPTPTNVVHFIAPDNHYVSYNNTHTQTSAQSFNIGKNFIGFAQNNPVNSVPSHYSAVWHEVPVQRNLGSNEQKQDLISEEDYVAGVVAQSNVSTNAYHMISVDNSYATSDNDAVNSLFGRINSSNGSSDGSRNLHNDPYTSTVNLNGQVQDSPSHIAESSVSQPSNQTFQGRERNPREIFLGISDANPEGITADFAKENALIAGQALWDIGQGDWLSAVEGGWELLQNFRSNPAAQQSVRETGTLGVASKITSYLTGFHF